MDIHRMEDMVTDILKERIRERMEAMGKNPSSLALEADLSRSAVRDILSGKAKNPGIVTIYAIARVLECSYAYLMGESDSLHYQEAKDILVDVFARTSDVSGTLEAGVFRQVATPIEEGTVTLEYGHRERKPLRSDHRYIHRDLYLYRVGDDSLEGMNVAKGDLLTAVFDPTSEAAPNGYLVVVAHRLAGTSVEELSARVVKHHGKGFTLSTAPADFGGTRHADLKVTGPADGHARYTTVENGSIFIEGVVVQLTRQLDM